MRFNYQKLSRQILIFGVVWPSVILNNPGWATISAATFLAASYFVEKNIWIWAFLGISIAVSVMAFFY